MPLNYRYIPSAIKNHLQELPYFVIWSIPVALVCAIACSVFMYLLLLFTTIRQEHFYLIYLLPIIGLAIGLLYYYSDKQTNEGNNAIISQIQNPHEVLPIKMVPYVLITTLLTHLGGGSAGREGTAIQMGASLADQFSRISSFCAQNRSTIITMGVAGGFAGLFGTPWAATFFALEFTEIGKINFKKLFPCLLTAYLSYYFTILFNIEHTHFPLLTSIDLTPLSLFKVALASIIFASASILFIWLSHIITRTAKHYIAYPPLRPFFGGIILIIAFLCIGDQTYMGLGLEPMLAAFTSPAHGEEFILKIIFTALTLAVGFKGGEVTPLFFIGATLGSYLSIYLHLPVDFLAALGLICVFCAATKTPFACLLIGIELFGFSGAGYFAIACLLTYVLSTRKGIYSTQLYSFEKNTLL